MTGFGTPSVSGDRRPSVAVGPGVAMDGARGAGRLGTWRKTRSGEGLTEVVAATTVERVSRRRRWQLEVQPCWAAAVPSIRSHGTRRNPGKGVDRLPAHTGRTVRASALENEGRVLGLGSEGSATPDPQAGVGAGGRAGLPKRSDRVLMAPHTESDRSRKRGGAEVNWWVYLSCDNCLLG
jgi:hypothetical protein